ncbi:class A beta-lactamase-related serine hydrolase [Trebonia kvetii]|uniref:Class A beta-lactamase-related serine hydrolase n=1 Tax=Trebonia kvetii TaxID=2480626 RepID=A0A6P2BZ28_9ACTN|nr:serine hydrolase domain-containing protein [Trebonia kvetii]TVZ04372.1 class A beta-lactamase-related serine hydrolase [Trebonia kvetii]
MTGGFTDDGLAALDAALARHTASGAVPGLVALVARGGQVHITTAGHPSLGDDAPIGRDAIFRIASLTKPVTGVAAMLLIQDGAMALDDPVAPWLPELSEPRVLRSYDAELSDTVPAERAITVEDLLSFRLGFGSIFTPKPLPILEAEQALELKTLGPPWPPTRHTPDQWIAAFGSLPLLDQPGERFRYNTGATLTGILIERVAGAPFAEVLSKRVFEPLGMTDTAFWVPSGKMGRFTTMYAPSQAARHFGGSGADGAELTLIDRPDGWYAVPPSLPDGAAGLVSTIDDIGAFAAMLAADGGGLLSPSSVALMLRDRATARDRAEQPWFFGEHLGWGLAMSVPADGVAPDAAADGMPRGYGWEGGSGTAWRNDPATGLTGILLTQRMMTSPEPPPVARDFWSAAYAAIAR